MEGFKNYIQIITAFILMGALLCGIIPAGSTKNTVKFVISVILMGIILSPIANLKKIDIQTDIDEYTSINGQNDKSAEYVAKKLESAIVSEVKKFADEKNIAEAEVFTVWEEGKLKNVTVGKQLYDYAEEISEIIGIPQEYIQIAE